MVKKLIKKDVVAQWTHQTVEIAVPGSYKKNLEDQDREGHCAIPYKSPMNLPI